MDPKVQVWQRLSKDKAKRSESEDFVVECKIYID
jgi:hypothetical protein